MGKLWKASAAVLLALAAIPSLALAQATGTITGTVTASESGGPLAGAQVNVQGTVRRTVTDAQGRYRISIEAGNYTVVGTVPGTQLEAKAKVTVKMSPGFCARPSKLRAHQSWTRAIFSKASLAETSAVML